jgi:drug/metabolite transporter (DMT)-like permease
VYNPGLVILFGLLTTIQLHIAKAMERQGIEIFDQLRAKLKGTPTEDPAKQGIKKPAIYIIGLILNNTTIVYTLAAQLYGPPALYTSTFGVGLVALMAYSHFVLHESISKREWWGSILIVVGTIIIGIEGTCRPAYDISQISVGFAATLLLIFSIAAGIAMGIAYLKNHPLMTGLVFGFVAGAFGGLDAVYKNIAQNLSGTPTLLPQSGLAWVFFVISFIIAGLAFIFTQWGFARQARASILVPAYNCMYILVPMIFQLILIPEFVLFLSSYIGIGLVLIGIWLMQVKQ